MQQGEMVRIEVAPPSLTQENLRFDPLDFFDFDPFNWNVLQVLRERGSLDYQSHELIAN